MGQPYINPNYFAQYPQYFQPQSQTNPYMQRMENLQQFQQTLQPQPTVQVTQYQPMGKVVDSVDVVKATDIPMDGNVYYFPTADGSAVFGKQWTMDGKTRILTYKPFEEPKPNEVSSETKESILEDFRGVLEGIQMDIQTLNEKVDRLGKAKTSKKDGGSDE
jgi:hypothetical protein